MAARRGERPDDVPRAFEIINFIFTALFTLELTLRVLAAGVRGFFCSKDECCWNLFDCLVVGGDLVYTALQVTGSGQDITSSVQDLTVIRMMRMLRITRATRVLKLIRFFKDLRMMVYSVLRSASALLWSLLLLAMTIYIFGLYFVHVVATQTYDEEVRPGDVAKARSRDLQQVFFGGVTQAMYTLYQAVSGGISWGEIGSVLIEINAVNAGILCLFTFFTTFALLNIITGIFVDTAINSAQNDKDEVILEEMHKSAVAGNQMRRLFLAADRDGSGSIDMEEMQRLLEDPEVRAHLSAIGIATDRAKGLFRLLDMDESGHISIDEFVFGCQRLKGNARSIDLATLMVESQREAEKHEQYFVWVKQQLQSLNVAMKDLERSLSRLVGEVPLREVAI